MIRALRLLRQSISIWYYDVFVLIAANLAWLILSLLILPLGPATAGLFYMANEAAKGEPLFFRLFVVGMRRYLVKSLQLTAALIVITALLVVNISFYLNVQSAIAQIIGIIWIYAIIFWGIFLNYPFALLVQMETPSVLKVLRNAALLTLDNVAISVSMSIITLVLIGLSIFPLGLLPFPFGFFSLLAIFQCKCVMLLIEKYEQKQSGRSSTG